MDTATVDNSSGGIVVGGSYTGISVEGTGLTSGEDEILLTTSKGQSIRFSEKAVRSMGRAAGGVTGIKLTKPGDFVVSGVIIPKVNKDIYLITVSEGGYGKRTPTKEHKVQNRGGSGVLTYKVTEKTGTLISAKPLAKSVESDMLIATQSGKVLRLSAQQIPALGRATQGVRLIRLDKEDRVTSATLISKEYD